MRCSTSEMLFEGLLDGTLSEPRRRMLTGHLEKCSRCTSVLEELRVIDALLITPRTLEPAPNFTFKAMAEIRAMPQPKLLPPRLPLWTLFGFYLAASWIAIAGWFAIGRPDAHAALTFVQHVVGAFAGVARVVATGFGYGYTGVAGVVTFLLLFDMALLAGVLVLRRRLPERL
jgi:anti-sigma factor RsiW